MIKTTEQALEHIMRSIQSLSYGARDSAAYSLYRVKAESKSRKAKELASALIALHKLNPDIKAMLRERKEWEKQIAN